jgi:RNA polymerase sigma-70 factor (ECF subfamily)
VTHRDLLFSMVYNLLGSVADTEDVLQDTWLAWAGRWAGQAAGPIASPRAYLVRVAVNRALAQQAAIARRREEYPGPWLPDPLIAASDMTLDEIAPDRLAPDQAARDQPGEDPAVRAESVSIALLVVLETLTPLERAVFVLHEVFGYTHAEIAEILDRSPAATRQVGHRAREHVHARRPRYRTDPQVRRRVTERFLAAVTGGDLGALMQVLAPDVTLWADGGGKGRAAGRHPVHGRDKVARMVIGEAFRHPVPDLAVRIMLVNGEPAALLTSAGRPYMVIFLDLEPGGDKVRGIYAVSNPDKLPANA